MTLDDLGIINDMERGWVRGVAQPLWHKRVYKMWYHMWNRCCNPNHKDYRYYKDSKIYHEFKYLSNYVSWISSQPRFQEFCESNSDILWCIDKDSILKGNKNYYPEYMMLTTFRENSLESLARNGNPFIYNNPSFSQRKPIIAVGSHILVFESLTEACHKGYATKSKLIDNLKDPIKPYRGFRWFYLDLVLL